MDERNLTLLGAPLTDESIPAIINEKTEIILSYFEKLQNLQPHVALVFLKNCFWIPKFTYLGHSIVSCVTFFEKFVLEKCLYIARNALLRSIQSIIILLLRSAFDIRDWFYDRPTISIFVMKKSPLVAWQNCDIFKYISHFVSIFQEKNSWKIFPER